MATSRQPATATKRKRALEQPLLSNASSDIRPYWPASPAFDPQRVLLRLLFFINSDRTKYVSVGFYRARDYQPPLEFGAIRSGGSKSIVLKDEHIDTLADSRFDPQLRKERCSRGSRVRERCLSPITSEKLRIAKTVFRHAVH